ncbi:MAG TPA: cupin domain-containing protein [Streptosporangiaceae bacterium]
MNAGAVVHAADVIADRIAAGASVRTMLDSGPDGARLARRLAEIPPGTQLDGAAGALGELWFVIGGSGTVSIDGHAGLLLQPDRGLWMPPGARYRVQAGDDAELRMDLVTLPPAAHGGPVPAQTVPLTSDLCDCEVETTGDRRFRVLFGPGRGCATATQFVGEIPPGKAPDHSHPYDEVVLVLEGEGIVHIDGGQHALSAGTCTHLPPGLLHCLENTGTTTLRVLGVFHPADSPAAKLEQRS